MWHKASELKADLNHLEELSDHDYLECLQKVDKHFQVHSTQRNNWCVEAFQGPQSLADRATVKESYNASYQKHKYYSRKVFDAVLADNNHGRPLLPHAASERRFVEAL